jgi:hypothetical protein
MIYATTPEEIALRRKAFIRKWRLKHRAVRTLPVNLFRKSPQKKLQADLDGARADCATLAARVSVAEQSLLDRQAEARKLARDNADEAALDTANGNVRKALDRVATLRAHGDGSGDG